MHVIHDELRFGDGDTVVEELLLFSADASGTATEVTHKGIYFGGTAVTPLYEGSTVTKPVPVMVEGTYKVFNRNTSKYETIHITAQDIQEYAANTPRDVAMNYEHRKGGEPIGWLRLKDTGVCKPLRTAQGEKLALFASMELFPEAAQKVQRGVYRDGSIELRPHAKEIIGHALTDFPIMRHTQFFSDDAAPSEGTTNAETPAHPAPSTAEPATVTVPSAQAPAESPQNNPAAELAPSSGVTDTEEYAEMDFAAELAKYGLKPEDLQHLPALIKSTEEAQATARLTNARTSVQQFSADEQGQSYLSGATLEAAAQLLVFGQNNADVEIHFGEGDAEVKTNPAGLVEQLLKGIRAVQVFGETAGPSADNIVPDVPATDDLEARVDEDRVAAIRARIKSNLNIPES